MRFQKKSQIGHTKKDDINSFWAFDLHLPVGGKK